MAREFSLQQAQAPTAPRGLSLGALISLVVHVAAALPLVMPHAAEAGHEDPIDQLVVFLLPPEQDAARETPTRGIDWGALAGNEGALDEPITPTESASAALTPGRAGDSTAAAPEPAGAVIPEESALSEIEVDSVVARDPNSVGPVYPPEMLEQRLEGSTFMHFVVDTSGRVDPETIRVLRSTHPAFTKAVREALLEMRFRPAIHASRRVRQWVEQNFAFRIVPATPAAPRDTT